MQIAAFRVYDGLYGVPVLIVEEFFRPIPVTGVPLTDSRIEGLIHHRGTTATVLNLRECLNKPAQTPAESSKMILLETTSKLTEYAHKLGIISSDEPIVLRVDKTESIINIEKSDINPRPAHIPYEFVEGVIRCNNDEYMMILNISSLVNTILENMENIVEA